MIEDAVLAKDQPIKFKTIHRGLLHIRLHEKKKRKAGLIEVAGESQKLLLTATILNNPEPPDKAHIIVENGQTILLPVTATMWPLEGQPDGTPGEYLLVYTDVMAVLEDESDNSAFQL